MDGFPQVCFIKNFCTNPNVIIGDYTYYDDPDGPQRFFENILTISTSSGTGSSSASIAP